MSFFWNESRIDGIPCDVTAVGGLKGDVYHVTFELKHATLEQIEAINWKRPRPDWKCPLPKGCGFDVTDIRYSMGARTYTVTLRLKEQYLGDISRYQAQIDALEEDKTRLEEDRTRLESDSANLQDTIQQLTGQLAEADETAIELYEALEAALAEQEPEPEEPVEQEPEHEEPEEVTEE